MKNDVELQVVYQRLDLLRCTPRFAKQAIHVRPHHCTGMIEAKEVVKFNFLQLPLAGHRTASALDWPISCARKVLPYMGRVMGVSVRLNDRIGLDCALNSTEKAVSALGALVKTTSIFFDRAAGDGTPRGHSGDFKPNNESRVLFNRKSY